jgi:hypothetical protein
METSCACGQNESQADNDDPGTLACCDRSDSDAIIRMTAQLAVPVRLLLFPWHWPTLGDHPSAAGSLLGHETSSPPFMATTNRHTYLRISTFLI